MKFDPKNTMGKYILDDEGNPVEERDLMKWADWFELSIDKRRIKQSIVGDATVSTVFLGLDHSWGIGKPILWETMVFPTEKYNIQEQYTSKEEALKRHEEIINELKTK